MIKQLHVSCVFLSGLFFFVRGIWMIADSSLLHRKWVKFTPHIIDTILLLSALYLATQIHQYPGTDSWLTAKATGLLCYIVLGMVALKYGKTKAIRVTAWLAALMVFGYIVMVAVTRSPFPFPGT